MTDDQIIEVVRAHKEGKTIQYRARYAPTEEWRESTFGWNFMNCDYRVNPEPREWHLAVWSNGKMTVETGLLGATGMQKLIRVREVIE